MSRSGEVRLQFGAEEETFRLGIKQWDALDDRLQVGPSVLAARLATGPEQSLTVLSLFPLLQDQIGRFLARDPREVLIQGLLGGGMDIAKAGRLVRNLEEDGGVNALLSPAYQVVMAALMGVNIEQPLGESAGAGDPSTLSQMDGSGSEKTASTPSAEQWASPPAKSTDARSGSSTQPTAGG